MQANILAAESSVTGTFNIAGGKRISLNELATIVINLLGKELDIIYEDPRPGDIKHSLADVSKAKDGFGHETRFDIKDGLKETIAWFQNQR